MRVSRSSDCAASTPGKTKNTRSPHNLDRRIMSRSQETKCERPEADTDRVSHRLHLGARLAMVIDHMDGSVRDGAARPGHFDQDLHLEFVAPAPQFSFTKLVQSEEAESALAVADFAAYERRGQPAANGVGVIAGARHEGAIEGARANHQVGSRLFGNAKQH